MLILSFKISVRTSIWVLLNIFSDFAVVRYVSCLFLLIKWVQSVQSLSHVRLCHPTDCSMPGLPVHHQPPEFTQTHVHLVSDTIQPSHPLSWPSPRPSIFPSIRVFSIESVLYIRWSKYWSYSFSISTSNEYSVLISFRIDWLDLLAIQQTLKSLLQWVRLVNKTVSYFKFLG